MTTNERILEAVRAERRAATVLSNAHADVTKAQILLDETQRQEEEAASEYYRTRRATEALIEEVGADRNNTIAPNGDVRFEIGKWGDQPNG